MFNNEKIRDEIFRSYRHRLERISQLLYYGANKISEQEKNLKYKKMERASAQKNHNDYKAYIESLTLNRREDVEKAEVFEGSLNTVYVMTKRNVYDAELQLLVDRKEQKKLKVERFVLVGMLRTEKKRIQDLGLRKVAKG